MSQGRSIRLYLDFPKHDASRRELSWTHFLIKRDFR
ncbi:hypothetical protein SAMN04489798_0176 [Pseudomonas arsenicoxydans]|uniref:Uncharacterized protein n=1 Tax=Pseudomonas arsenicoxydans TaxID=702115 RepID=A0A1H0AZW9_9PSED|nr:hypothetical protein SAMN04489798_0176 [Pseudomonas arsenicoxydans]